MVQDEVEEGLSGVTKNKIKISGNKTLEVLKSGNVNSHLYFDVDKDCRTFYKTPYGKMTVDVHTNKISVKEEEERIHLNLSYGLDVNHEPVADCNIEIDIQPKKINTFGF